MAQEPDWLAFRFGVVLAVAMTILAIRRGRAPRILTAIRLRRSRGGKRSTGLSSRMCTEERVNFRWAL